MSDEELAAPEPRRRPARPLDRREVREVCATANGRTSLLLIHKPTAHRVSWQGREPSDQVRDRLLAELARKVAEARL